MKNHCVFAPFALAIAAATAASAGAQEVLTGDTRLACEATLCLAASTRPSECAPSLSRYFSIHKRKWSDTVRARASFLSLCPLSDQTPEMRSLDAGLLRGLHRAPVHRPRRPGSPLCRDAGKRRLLGRCARL